MAWRVPRAWPHWKDDQKCHGFPSKQEGLKTSCFQESWVPKNGCFWTVVLEKTLESHFDCKEIQTVYPKGDQSWIFIGRTDAKAETPILWPPDVKNRLTGKDPDAWKDLRQEEKGTTEDEMVGWHHWLNGHQFGCWWWTGEAWQAAVHGVTKNRTWLSNWTELNMYVNHLGPVSCFLPSSVPLGCTVEWHIYMYVYIHIHR